MRHAKHTINGLITGQIRDCGFIHAAFAGVFAFKSNPNALKTDPGPRLLRGFPPGLRPR